MGGQFYSRFLMLLTELNPTQLTDPEVQKIWTPVAREFFVESGYPGEFNPTHFWTFWSQLTGLDMGRFYVAYREDGEPAGAFGCMFTPDALTGLPSALEHFWFVRQFARGSGKIALSLFNLFEAECDRRRVKTRFMAHIHGHGGEVLARFYRRKGYLPADKFFRKDTV